MAEIAAAAADFLNAEIDPSCHSLFPPALRRAYETVNHFMETVGFLLTPGGKFQRGDLIACAAEDEIQKLVHTGRLGDLHCTWEDYARPTGKHLVVHTRRGKLTISQVQDSDTRPRRAEFRSEYQVTNMPYLFEQMNREVEADQAKKHILLVHGYKELTFAHLMLPHRMKDRPIHKTDNLLTLPHLQHQSERGEGPSESPDPESTEHLIRLVRDNDTDR
jgi:hypothetical protein